MFSPGGYNRGLHGRPQARTLTAIIVQRLVDECPMSAMGPIASVRRCLRHVRSTSNNCRDYAVPRTAESANSGREQTQQHLNYSITSSAVASRVGGIANPSAFAAFRLTTGSSFIEDGL